MGINQKLKLVNKIPIEQGLETKLKKNEEPQMTQIKNYYITGKISD
jgi:hypothetical protein